jgi:hypothetical protein
MDSKSFCLSIREPKLCGSKYIELGTASIAIQLFQSALASVFDTLTCAQNWRFGNSLVGAVLCVKSEETTHRQRLSVVAAMMEKNKCTATEKSNASSVPLVASISLGDTTAAASTAVPTTAKLLSQRRDTVPSTTSHQVSSISKTESPKMHFTRDLSIPNQPLVARVEPLPSTQSTGAEQNTSSGLLSQEQQGSVQSPSELNLSPGEKKAVMDRLKQKIESLRAMKQQQSSSESVSTIGSSVSIATSATYVTAISSSSVSSSKISSSVDVVMANGKEEEVPKESTDNFFILSAVGDESHHLKEDGELEEGEMEEVTNDLKPSVWEFLH